MNDKWIRSLLFVALCVLSVAPESRAESVAEVHARWNEALESGDQESVRSLFDEDGLIAFSLPDRRWTSTFDGWLSTFAKTFAQGYGLSVRDREIQVHEAAESGWIFAVQELTWTSADGEGSSRRWLWHTTEVWERRGDDWKIVHVHHGPAPEGEESDD